MQSVQRKHTNKKNGLSSLTDIAIGLKEMRAAVGPSICFSEFIQVQSPQFLFVCQNCFV
jgi:hypothetical protein